MKRIPIFNVKKKVVAYALVDDQDYFWLSGYRWHLHTIGYATRGVYVDGKTEKVSMHREILGLKKGNKLQGDHINGVRLDNRRKNLRVVTVQQQRQNVRAGYGASKIRGVLELANGKWRACVKLGRRSFYLGRYQTKEEASQVASLWRAENMPYSTDALFAGRGVP